MLLQVNYVFLNEVKCPQEEGDQVMGKWSYCVLEQHWSEVESVILQARPLLGTFILSYLGVAVA